MTKATRYEAQKRHYLQNKICSPSSQNYTNDRALTGEYTGTVAIASVAASWSTTENFQRFLGATISLWNVIMYLYGQL